MCLCHGCQTSGHRNSSTLVVLAAGDCNNSGTYVLHGIARNSSCYRFTLRGRHDHLTCLVSCSSGSRANRGVLGTHMADWTHVGGVSGQVSSGVSGNDHLASFSSNRAIWLCGDESSWEVSTLWTYWANVGGVCGQRTTGVGGNNVVSCFSGNGTISVGGDESRWDQSTQWADWSNVSGVSGQQTSRVSGYHVFSSFSRD